MRGGDMRIGGLVLATAVIVSAGCATTPPSVSPETSATPVSTGSPSPSALIASPTATPTSTPTPTATPLLVTVPIEALRSLPMGASAVFGSRVFTFDSSKTGTLETITMRDLATGAASVLGRTSEGHYVDAIVATATRLLWVETWRRDHPTPPGYALCLDQGRPLRWRIVVMVLATRARSVIASGSNVRTAIDGECADVNPPVIAVDGDRVAYTLELASRAHPFANRIVVRSLVDSTRIRTIATAGLVEDLALHGPVVAYRDNVGSDPSLGAIDPYDGRLMVATADDAPPVRLDVHVRAASIGEGRIAWARADTTDGSVWTEVLGSHTKRLLRPVLAPDFQPESVSQIAVGRATVAWVIWGTANSDTGTSRLALWTDGGLGPGLVDGFAQPGYVALGGGWLVWDAELGADGGEPGGLYGLPVSALGGH